MLIPWQALQLVGRLPCLLSCTMHPSPQGLHMPHGAYRALRTAHMGERVCVFEPVCVDGLAPQARASLESCTRPSGTAQWWVRSCVAGHALAVVRTPQWEMCPCASERVTGARMRALSTSVLQGRLECGDAQERW